MKRIILVFAAIASAVTVFAQNACSNGDPLFKFDNGTKAQEIHTLGANPEFPFLRNLSTPQQVYDAIKRNEKSQVHKDAMDKLNSMMIAIGFDNGVKDLQVSDISADHVPSGAEGNMGTGDLISGYFKLTGDPTGYKAWKISSPSGCYVDIMAKCGNAFYPNPDAGKTACVSAPVNVTSTPKEVTLSNPATQVTDRTYVYYHMKKNKKDEDYKRPDIADDNPSKPLLLGAVKKVEANPETYRLTVSAPTDNVNVCPDKPIDVAADVNVEQVSSFTGNYPGTATDSYKEVSKREYKRAERKMSKVEKKEEKVSSITGVPVNIEQ